MELEALLELRPLVVAGEMVPGSSTVEQVSEPRLWRSLSRSRCLPLQTAVGTILYGLLTRRRGACSGCCGVPGCVEQKEAFEIVSMS